MGERDQLFESSINTSEQKQVARPAARSVNSIKTNSNNNNNTEILSNRSYEYQIRNHDIQNQQSSSSSQQKQQQQQRIYDRGNENNILNKYQQKKSQRNENNYRYN